MDYSRAIFLISDTVRAVNCTYEKDQTTMLAPRVMFKTMNPEIREQDYVVVPTGTRHGMTVVQVVECDVEPDLDSNDEIQWIIGVVDQADFEAIKAQESQAVAAIKAAEKRQKRKELREKLLANAEGDLKKLPIYTAENGEPAPAAPAPQASDIPDDPED